MVPTLLNSNEDYPLDGVDLEDVTPIRELPEMLN
jgi:hypothetical protein